MGVNKINTGEGFQNEAVKFPFIEVEIFVSNFFLMDNSKVFFSQWNWPHY